ncbi:hypothetical protein Plhal304r1_c066g0153611 [Plasmopara halstedii]
MRDELLCIRKVRCIKIRCARILFRCRANTSVMVSSIYALLSKKHLQSRFRERR